MLGCSWFRLYLKSLVGQTVLCVLFWSPESSPDVRRTRSTVCCLYRYLTLRLQPHSSLLRTEVTEWRHYRLDMYVTVFIIFLFAMIKFLTKVGWGRKGLFRLTTQGHSPPWWTRHGGRCVTQYMWLHPQLGSRERWILMFSLLFPLYSIWDSGLWNCATHIQDGISLPDEPSLETLLQTSRRGSSPRQF